MSRAPSHLTRRAAPVASLALVLAGCGGESEPAAAAAGATPFAFPHQPAGCGYAVDMDATRASALSWDAATLGDEASPKRVRLGLGGGTRLGEPDYADPSTTTSVLWDTDADTLATALAIGSSPDDLGDRRQGFSYLLPTLVSDAPAVRIHRVDVCGLEPETTYYYKVGGGPAGQESWSDVRAFTTLPAPGAASLTVGVSGDSRNALDTVWPLLQSRLAKGAMDMQVFQGDAIALAIGDMEKEIAAWFDAAESEGALGAMPIYATGGNHEAVQAPWLANHGYPGGGIEQGLYFSFDAGPVHFALFDDEIVSRSAPHPLFPESTADSIVAWLEADLAAADARRDVVPWVVVTHHRGVLSTSNHGEDGDVLRLRDVVMPIYDANHVNLVLAGHDHNYERTTPVTGPADAPVAKSDTADGTVYVVCAGAGAPPYGSGDAPVAYRASTTEYGDGTPYAGLYGVIEASGDELAWRAYGLKSSGATIADDDPLDEVGWTN